MNNVRSFLHCPTPQAWLTYAVQNLEILLIDHAHCEKKAASTALKLMYRYVDRPELLQKMSRLAREELRHFEQVHTLLQRRGITYRHIDSGIYAGSLYKQARTFEPQKLIDTLIIGAIIEARSCERFAALAPHLDEEVAIFYQKLLVSEARHYENYLSLAKTYSPELIDVRVQELLSIEATLINTPDPVFRFHSGVPPLQAL